MVEVVITGGGGDGLVVAVIVVMLFHFVNASPACIALCCVLREVEDPYADEIHLCICYQDESAGPHDNNNGGKTHTEKTGALKG